MPNNHKIQGPQNGYSFKWHATKWQTELNTIITSNKKKIYSKTAGKIDTSLQLTLLRLCDDISSFLCCSTCPSQASFITLELRCDGNTVLQIDVKAILWSTLVMVQYTTDALIEAFTICDISILLASRTWQRNIKTCSWNRVVTKNIMIYNKSFVLRWYTYNNIEANLILLS